MYSKLITWREDKGVADNNQNLLMFHFLHIQMGLKNSVSKLIIIYDNLEIVFSFSVCLKFHIKSVI